MLTFNGYSAWIECDGTPVIEHLVSTDEEEERISCWIAGEPGKQFTVHWMDHDTGIDTMAFIQLDGFLCPGRFLFGTGRTQRDAVRVSDNTERPFMFAKVTDASDSPKSKPSTARHPGTIVLKLMQVEKGKPIPQEKRFLPPPAKSARSSSDIIVGFGPERTTFTRHSTTVSVKPYHKTKTRQYVSFCFRYRSKEWLERELHIRQPRNISTKFPKTPNLSNPPTPKPPEDDLDWPPESQDTEYAPEDNGPFLPDFGIYPPLTLPGAVNVMGPSTSSALALPSIDKGKARAGDLGRGPPPLNLLSKPKINLATKPSGSRPVSRAPSLTMPPPPGSTRPLTPAMSRAPTAGPPTPSPTTAPVTPVAPQTQLMGAQQGLPPPAPSWGYIWPNGNYASAPPHMTVGSGPLDVEMGARGPEGLATPSPSPETPPTVLPKKGKVSESAAGKRKPVTRSASGASARSVSGRKQPNASGWSSSPSRRTALPGEGLMMFEEGLKAANATTSSPVWETPIPGGAMDE